VKIRVRVDGEAVELELEPRVLLSDALREAGKPGVHVGCEQGVCGTCTVLLDGLPVRSCLLLAVQAHNRDVTTVHGLDAGVEQEALRAARALQCGFCTPGIVVTLAGLRANGLLPRDVDSVRELASSHLCRCTGYRGLVEAIERLTADA
jgi:aerobic-type carbon monoxide dehydrogenase small subunit (CoxS/CutS family)